MTSPAAPSDIAAALEPPVAERRPVTHELHGRTRTDAYAWLRDENWRDAMRDPSTLRADIRAHLEAENAYAKAWMADTVALQDALFNEMRGRIKEEDEGLPTPDGPFAYYSRTRRYRPEAHEGQYAVFVRKPIDPSTQEPIGPEEVLFDGDREAQGRDYFALGGLDHSPDHTLIAYGVDLTGSEYYTLRFRRIADGAHLDDVIENTTGGVVWANDSRTVFWVWRDDNGRPCKVYRRELGSGRDDLIYEEADLGFFVSLGKTESERFIVIDAHDHTTSEVRLIDADAPATAPRLIAARERGVEYDVSDRGERLYILTNVDGAIDFKVMTAPLATPERAHWTDWVAHRDGVLVLGQRLFAGHHVRLERENALPRIVIRRFEDDAEHSLSLDEEAYSLGLSGLYAFDTSVMRFSYSSPTTPDQVFAYDMNTRERRLLKTRDVPSGHEPSDYVTRRVLAPAADGETVPVTILHHRDTPIDGSAPVLLYGYGSYGHTIPAGFGTTRLSLCDRGVVFAIAHVRGGMAKGYRWYLDGKLEKKPNTFTDFIAAGEALIAEGYTARGRIVAMGGSAGGLLVGAALNLAPDLFAGVAALVPFVDVLNTMADAELPLTPPEWPEWGNPLQSAEAYDRLASYSPYDNVRAVAYPPVLVTAGVSDPRVTYWEPAKWAAKLRACSTGPGPVLLKTNMDAGHGGASGRFDSLKETAFEFAFVLKVIDRAATPPRPSSAAMG